MNGLRVAPILPKAIVLPNPIDLCNVLYDSANRMQDVANPIIAKNLKIINATMITESLL